MGSAFVGFCDTDWQNSAKFGSFASVIWQFYTQKFEKPESFEIPDRELRLPQFPMALISVGITKMLMGGQCSRAKRAKNFFPAPTGGARKSWSFGCDEQYEMFHAVYCHMRQNHQCSIDTHTGYILSSLPGLLLGKRDTSIPNKLRHPKMFQPLTVMTGWLRKSYTPLFKTLPVVSRPISHHYWVIIMRTVSVTFDLNDFQYFLYLGSVL